MQFLTKKPANHNPLILILYYISMKTLFIEAKLKDLNIKLSKSELSKLPKKLFLAYSIQFKPIISEIKKQLESSGIQIEKTQQVLGCSKINIKLPLLLVGQGRFHARNLYLQSPSIFILEGSKIHQIPSQDIEKLKKKRQAALLKFLHADNVGILVTTKPGQENLNQAIILRKKLEKQGKKAYIFMANNIDIGQFENFQIDSWINTACSGLAMDNPQIINFNELPK